jgi:hypothetical protein
VKRGPRLGVALFVMLRNRYVHTVIRLEGSFVSSRARSVLAAALGLRN